MSEGRPPLPPFTVETAAQKARMAENAWNNQDPIKVSIAYTKDREWRNRDQFFSGRDKIIKFLTQKWVRESEYRHIKEVWVFHGNHMAARFVYESQDIDGNWWRSFGNERWEFDERGLMARRQASINDVSIQESDRMFLWAQGPRPDDHPGLTELGL